MSITTLRQQIIIQLTPSSATDKVDASELRYVSNLTADQILALGVYQAATTAELATLTSVDAQFCYVDGIGFFKYRQQALSSDTTTYPSSDGGVWALVVANGGGGTTTVDLSGVVPITRQVNGYPLNDDIVLSSADIAGVNLVDNTPDISKIVSTPQAEAIAVVDARVTALAATVKQNTASINSLSTSIAFKADLIGGQVPTNELPSYVSDVLEFSTRSAFPVTGQSNKLYVATDDPTKLYRWTGSIYVNVAASGGGGGGGSTTLDKYFTTIDGQTVVSLSETISKYVLSVRIGLDNSWQVIHGGTGTLADYQVRHDATAGTLTFGSALPASDNNVALYY